MIDLASANTPVSVELLDIPGGFAWWYVDLVDDQGDGIVLIWSFGLPFLPGIASDARKGRPSAPRSRPSLTLSVYEGGVATAYLLQEYDPVQATWEPAQGEEGVDRWRFGESSIRSQARSGRREVEVQLSCELPGGGRLEGSITVSGASCMGVQTRGSQGAEPVHAWAPLAMVATGSADLQINGRQVRLSGRAYHDRNSGQRPLHDLGIRRWSWGRLAFLEREVIWYHLEPEAPGQPTRDMVLEVRPDGQLRAVEDHAVEVGPQRWSPFGLRWPRWIRFKDVEGEQVEVRFHHKVDDGPFYHRYLVEGLRNGESARGVAELVVPDRVDLPWMRPLVRMRVHHAQRANSFWLPLFTGTREGRVGRLLGQLSPRSRPALERGT